VFPFILFTQLSKRTPLDVPVISTIYDHGRSGREEISRHSKTRLGNFEQQHLCHMSIDINILRRLGMLQANKMFVYR